MLSYYLDELPHEIIEARSAEEAKALYRRTPGALIIFDDDMPEESIADAVADIRIFEGEHNFRWPPSSRWSTATSRSTPCAGPDAPISSRSRSRARICAS